MGRINRLIPTTTLTANSVIAMDAESGGATNKVTIQTLAAGLRSFGDYATQAQLAAKQDVLTFDDSPEEDSENPVTSGGIYNAIGSAMSNVYTKAETDNAIAQSTAHAYQEGNGGLQLNSTLMACNMLLLIFRRYGYWDSLIVSVWHIKGGLTSAGAFIRFGTTEIKVTINATGLVTLTGNGASDLIVHAWGLF